MNCLTIDASVMVKWCFPTNDKEQDIEKALSILKQVRADKYKLIQPPHWLAEVSAVICRLRPKAAKKMTGLLYAMSFSINEDLSVFYRAIDLATKLDHHLFDTLYHAVALNFSDCQLITADEKYYHKAKQYGSITLLAHF